MTRAEELGHIAWQEYYDGMARHYDMHMARKTYWTCKYYKQLVKLGALCDEHNTDVGEFMATAFGLILKDKVYITPKDFTNPDIWRQYEALRAQRGSSAQHAWCTQVMELTTLECDMIPNIYATEEALLLDSRQPFNAWFRVLYPEQFSERLYDMYGVIAWGQLRTDRPLRAFLRKQVGANVKELERRAGQFDDIAGAQHG